MTLISANKTGSNTAEIKFSIDPGVFSAEVTKVFKKRAPKISIPGFRPGKAPRHIIEKMYGKGVFYEEALNNLLPDEYEAARKESGLETVGSPEIDVENIGDEGVTIIAKTAIKPEVELKQYKGLAATRKVEKATAEEVDAEVEQVRSRNARMIEITDRAAQKDDTVTIDYSGSVDGVAFEGGTAEKQELKLGSGTFIPGFEEQVEGHSIGDEFDVNVTFPTEYHAAELAGKDAVFACKLHGIRMTELPALDDEFAKDVSEFDTLDEYKADILAKIQKRKDSQADNEVEGQLIDALMENLEADIPEEMFRIETENQLRDFDMNLRSQGLDLNTYIKYTGGSLDDIRGQLRPRAERGVKTRLALEKIAALESLVASEDEINEEIKKLAEGYNMPEEEVRKYVDTADVKKDIEVRKAVEFVKENAAVTEEAAAEAASEKPAKKTTRKKSTTTKKKAAESADAPAETAEPAAEKADSEG